MYWAATSGFIAAVSFATILAVVAGLTLSGAASHDLWVNVVRGGHANESEQLKWLVERRWVVGYHSGHYLRTVL